MRLPNGSRQKKRGRFGISAAPEVSTPASLDPRPRSLEVIDLEAEVPPCNRRQTLRIRNEVDLQLGLAGREPDHAGRDEHGRGRLLLEAEHAAVEGPALVLGAGGIGSDTCWSRTMGTILRE